MNNVIAIDGEALYFSDDTPAEIGRLFARAALIKDPAEKREFLRKGTEDFTQALEVHIAYYKACFRTGKYRAAECAVWRTLRIAAQQGGFRWNYRVLTPQSAAWLDDKSVARLYLFSLKALGVIRLRRGRVELAERVLSKVLQLDPHDELGAGNFLDIARSFETSDQ